MNGDLIKYNNRIIEEKVYKLYAYFLLIIPILITLDRFIGSAGTLLTGIPFVLGLIILLYQRKKILKYILLLVLFIINMCISENKAIQFELVKPLVIFFTVFDLIENKKFLNILKEILNKNIKFLHITILTVLVINLFLYFENIHIGFSEIDTKSWGTIVFKGTYDDPHQAAYRFCSLIVYSVFLIKYCKNTIILNLIELMAAEFLLLMTGARTPTALGILLGIIAISNLSEEIKIMIKKHKKAFIGVSIVFIIGLIIFIPNTAFFKKMISSTKWTFDNGRTILREAEWNYFIKSSFENKLFGNDVNDVYNVNKESLGAAIWCHNDIMQILLQFGVIVLIVYLYTFIKSLVINLKQGDSIKNKLALCILYFAFIFVAFFNGFFFHPRFIIVLPILFIIFENSDKNKKEEKENSDLKIAVITRHSVPNYGSILQTYATQRVIDSLGYESEVINYIRYEERCNNLANTLIKGKKWEKNFITKLIYKMIQTPNYAGMYNKFVEYRKELLNETKLEYGSMEELKNNLPKADVYCSGSDQIWGKIGSVDYDEAYFLEFVEDKKCISYASSFGKTELVDSLKINIKKLFKKYTTILVREDSAKKILNDSGFDNVEHVLDPTLLLSKQEWIDLSYKARIEEKDYVLVYQLHDNKEFDNYAKDFAKRKNLKLLRISTSFYHITRSGTLIYLPTPYEFLWYFNNAKYILTDSFHATVFSIIFNKKFIDILPSNKTGTRIESILNLLEIDNRILTDYKDFESIDKNIDYYKINLKLELERNKSLDLLKKAIEE